MGSVLTEKDMGYRKAVFWHVLHSISDALLA